MKENIKTVELKATLAGLKLVILCFERAEKLFSLNQEDDEILLKEIAACAKILHSKVK